MCAPINELVFRFVANCDIVAREENKEEDMGFSIDDEGYVSPKTGMASGYDDSRLYNNTLKFRMSNKDFMGTSGYIILCYETYSNFAIDHLKLY